MPSSFVQGSNGLEETFTAEFTPVSHALARIDAPARDCRALADNVTFTITAGKWTDVDVPMTLRACKLHSGRYAIGDHTFDGGGTVHLTVFPSIGLPIPVADCTITEVGDPPYYQWTDFHACHGVAPYGARATATVTPGLNSLFAFVDSAAVDTVAASDGFGFTFWDSINPHPNGISLHADLGISLVGGSAQRFVSNSIFRIVNHGPNNAYHVFVLLHAIASETENVDGVTVAVRLGGAIVLAFLPLFFIPATRKRKAVLAVLLVVITSVAVVSCGGDSTGPQQIHLQVDAHRSHHHDGLRCQPHGERRNDYDQQVALSQRHAAAAGSQTGVAALFFSCSGRLHW